MSDRELDAQVAGRVFGWHVIGGVGIAPGGIGAEKIRPFSSTWEGAGLVIEEMQRRGIRFAFFKYDGDREVNRWTAMFAGLPRYDAPTLPEAVAKAALAALGTPVEVRDEV